MSGFGESARAQRGLGGGGVPMPHYSTELGRLAVHKVCVQGMSVARACQDDASYRVFL